MQPRTRLHGIQARITMAAASILVLALALLSSSCAGGSGSSGFDLAENTAIDMALDEQRCVESDGLTICPAGTPTHSAPEATMTRTATPPPPTPTPTNDGLDSPTETPSIPSANQTVTATPLRTSPRPTATPQPTTTPTATRESTPTPTVMTGMSVDTSFGTPEGTTCVPGDTPGVCILPFTFAAQGFSMETHYQVAARSDTNAPWELFDALEISFDAPGSVFGADIPITSAATGPMVTASLQTAVLVFVDQPPLLPAMEIIETLAESGADFAYVSPVEQITVVQ